MGHYEICNIKIENVYPTIVILYVKTNLVYLD